MGFASGFAAGWVGGTLGGTYSNGNLSFLDSKGSKALNTNLSLFYAGKLNNFANTIGSVAGEAVNYAYGGNFRISLGHGIRMAFTHDGRIVNDTSGGVGLVNLVDAIGSLNYVGFQYQNVHSGDEGLSRISYVNMGYLSGDMQNMKTSMDVKNNKKKIVFDLEGSGNYGYAGKDNRTIHLNKEAILRDDDESIRAKLAHCTATAMHEGLHIDQHEWLAQNGGYMDDVTLERMAYMQSTKTLAMLNLRFGLNVSGSEYEDAANKGAYFAMTGNPYGLDISGRSLLVVKGDKDIQTLKEKYGIEIKKLLIQGPPYVGKGGLISKINEDVFNVDEKKRPNGQDRLLELIYDPKRVFDFSDKKVKDYVETSNIKGDSFLTAVGNGIYGFFSGLVNLISIPFNFIKQPVPGVDGIGRTVYEKNANRIYSWEIDYNRKGGPWEGMLRNEVELGSIMIDPVIKSMENNIPPSGLFDSIYKIDSIIKVLNNNWFGKDELDRLVDNKEYWRDAGAFMFGLVGKSALKSLVPNEIRTYISIYDESLVQYFVNEYLDSIKGVSYVHFEIEPVKFIHFDYEKYKKWYKGKKK